jgi:dienelactone hydrolase
MITKNINYTDDNVALEGYLACPANAQKKLPVVLIAHDWTGHTEFTDKKAEKIAELGYIGFALDMFGKGIIGKNNDEKMRLIQPFMENRMVLQKRMLAALDTVKKLDMVDTTRIAAMGFCFGGLCALDLARSGTDIRGVVSFHGLLNPADGVAKNKIKAKVLALHGHDDPMVPPDVVLNFQKEMTEAGADWQTHIYGNTLHAFTNPVANDASFGTVYNRCADARSWQAMQNFFAEIFS